MLRREANPAKHVKPVTWFMLEQIVDSSNSKKSEWDCRFDNWNISVVISETYLISANQLAIAFVSFLKVVIFHLYPLKLVVQ